MLLFLQVSNIIFLDQPVGTGFSYTNNSKDYVKDSKGAGEDVWDFMQAFLRAYPEYAGRPFFVTGESYAGHYIPLIAKKILSANKAKAKGTIRINFQVWSASLSVTSCKRGLCSTPGFSW